MARVTANPQKNPAASRPALKPFPPAPATAKATKLSPRKTRTNVPSTSARYFLVQLSLTAIYLLLLSFDQISRDNACVDGLAPFAPPLADVPKKKVLTCTLRSERIGQDFSLHVPPVAAAL